MGFNILDSRISVQGPEIVTQIGYLISLTIVYQQLSFQVQGRNGCSGYSDLVLLPIGLLKSVCILCDMIRNFGKVLVITESW